MLACLVTGISARKIVQECLPPISLARDDTVYVLTYSLHRLGISKRRGMVLGSCPADMIKMSWPSLADPGVCVSQRCVGVPALLDSAMILSIAHPGFHR